MLVKKFEAPSLEQALAQVKQEMGPNALILSTNEKKGRWFNAKLIEVTAAFEKKNEAAFDDEALEKIFPHRKRPKEKAEAKPAPVPVKASGAAGVHIDPLKYEKELMEKGFSTETAREVSRRLVIDYPKKDLTDPGFLVRVQSKLLAPALRTFSLDLFETKPNWAVVGLPGAGKTTFLVKLAVHLKSLGRTSQLVSCDDRKVIGRSELAAYAKLVELPFDTDVKAAGDLSFVDTPALSHPASEAVETACRNRNVVLVLDASTRLGEMLRAVEAAQALTPTALAFTRLDLVHESGGIHDLMKQTKLPLLGLSTSFALRDGFKAFDPEGLARYLLNRNLSPAENN